MKDYVPSLKNHHEDIRASLERSLAYWDQGLNEKTLLEVKTLHSLLADHHKAETERLFSLLKGLPQMNQGGPFCSYFFEFFMTNRPLARIENLIAQHRGQIIKILPAAEIEDYFSTGSLLTVPLEEHMASETLCSEILLSLQENPTTTSPWIGEALQTLRDIVHSNLQKEESCLWVAAQYALGPSTIENLSRS